jgi:hypothetical protein
MKVRRRSENALSGGRWWLMNIGLFAASVSIWSIGLNWWPDIGTHENVLTLGFFVGTISDLLIYLFFSGVFLALYLTLIYAGRIRSRIGTILWSPILGIGLWGGLTNYGPATLVLGVMYALIVRLRK